MSGVTFNFSSSVASVSFGGSFTLTANLTNLSDQTDSYTIEFVEKTAPYTDPSQESVLQTVNQTPSSGAVNVTSSSITPSTPGYHVYLGRVTTPISQDSTPIIVTSFAASSTTVTAGTQNGTNQAFAVTVANTSEGYSGTPSGSVLYSADGTQLGAVTLDSGSASFTASTTGVTTFTVTYPGDNIFSGSSGTASPN